MDDAGSNAYDDWRHLYSFLLDRASDVPRRADRTEHSLGDLSDPGRYLRCRYLPVVSASFHDRMGVLIRNLLYITCSLMSLNSLLDQHMLGHWPVDIHWDPERPDRPPRRVVLSGPFRNTMGTLGDSGVRVSINLL